nr:unnamed protein product [Callosobruchus chinensis]
MQHHPSSKYAYACNVQTAYVGQNELDKSREGQFDLPGPGLNLPPQVAFSPACYWCPLTLQPIWVVRQESEYFVPRFEDIEVVQRRAIRLIGDPALTCHLQPLSHRRRRAVGDLSLFYRTWSGYNECAFKPRSYQIILQAKLHLIYLQYFWMHLLSKQSARAVSRGEKNPPKLCSAHIFEELLPLLPYPYLIKYKEE